MIPNDSIKDNFLKISLTATYVRKKLFLLLFFSFLHACIAQKYQCTDNEHALFFRTLSRHTLHIFTYSYCIGYLRWPDCKRKI